MVARLHWVVLLIGIVQLGCSQRAPDVAGGGDDGSLLMMSLDLKEMGRLEPSDLARRVKGTVDTKRDGSDEITTIHTRMSFGGWANWRMVLIKEVGGSTYRRIQVYSDEALPSSPGAETPPRLEELSKAWFLADLKENGRNFYHLVGRGVFRRGMTFKDTYEIFRNRLLLHQVPGATELDAEVLLGETPWGYASAFLQFREISPGDVERFPEAQLVGVGVVVRHQEGHRTGYHQRARADMAALSWGALGRSSR